MEQINLRADWFVQYKTLLPWERLVGATIVSNEGRAMLVLGVKLRDWPLGPVMDMRYLDEPHSAKLTFNIKGFESGRLHEVLVAEPHIEPFRQFLVSLEDERKATAEASRRREAAERDERKKKVAETAERNRTEAQAAAEAISLLNASRQFDLLLFDLDDTLVKSSRLERFRGKENVGNRSRDYLDALTQEARQLTYLVPEATLLGIRQSFPDLQLGIFTRAPRAYAETVLAQCYPGVEWDCVVAYEDVDGSTKPKPDGIFAAARAAGVAAVNRIALVGDEKSDVIAAYQAGAFAVLFQGGWDSSWNDKDNPKRSEHYRALDFLADAIVGNPGHMVQLITHPWEHLLALEAWDAAWVNGNLGPAMRIDRRFHFNNLQLGEGASNYVVVHVMGRYFKPHYSGDRFDFRPKSDGHRLTLAILAAKDGDPYPDSWVACCVRHVSSIAEDIRNRGGCLVVCPVPARPGRPGRLERLIERISDQLGEQDNLTFDPEILGFKEGVASNRTLDQEQRFINIRDHLVVADKQAVTGRHILVIDDVTTSGATFYYADRYLKTAGARNVYCLALAQTVS